MELKYLKGIGKITLEHFNELNITSIEELLYFFPKKYKLYVVDNFLNEYYYSTCRIKIETKPYFMPYKKDVFTIIFYTTINGIKIKCLLFGKSYLRSQIVKDKELIIYGKYKKNLNEFSILKIFTDLFSEHVEIDYCEKNLKNFQISKAIKAIYQTNPTFIETLPIELIEKYKLLPIETYLYYSHLADNKKEYFQVIRRRKYEELFWYAISLNLLSYNRKHTTKPKRNINKELYINYIKSLNYTLTNDQLTVIDNIYLDLVSDIPMNRLVQGDVGCGKTIVALIAIIMMISAGFQAAVMVPTEVLAKQQFAYISNEIKKIGYKTELLTSSTTKKEKNEILKNLYDGKIHVIVGTHSLIEDNVEFKNLGLAVIDEQHKFGVEQRRSLIEKLKFVDSIYLTATPIPRTLGMTEFGDLDISSIKTMPNGRIPIKTRIVDYSILDKMMGFLNGLISKKEQIYVVVPHVLESDFYQAMDIDTAYKLFSERLNGKIGVVHGKMKSADKTMIMKSFEDGEIDCLISTTVIEVGVNVTNATAMVIMDAHMFGLAQMHQLRGRVGRGSKKSYCFLVTNEPKNERLLTMESTLDGFMISQMDFQQRGSGDYLGVAQSGNEGLDFASIELDKKIWECAKADADIYINSFMNREIESKKFNELLQLSVINKGINN